MPDQIHTPIVGILGIAVRVLLDSVCLYSYWFYLLFQWWFSLVVITVCFLAKLFPALCCFAGLFNPLSNPALQMK